MSTSKITMPEAEATQWVRASKKYSVKYAACGLETEIGAWHNFRVLCGAEEVATCCMFLFSVDGEIDEDGTESEAGNPDCKGLHYGDGAREPDAGHSDLDLADLQDEALALIGANQKEN